MTGGITHIAACREILHGMAATVFVALALAVAVVRHGDNKCRAQRLESEAKVIWWGWRRSKPGRLDNQKVVEVGNPTTR